MTHHSNEISRSCGLLVIEVINSNPNGDPDNEGEPRQRPDGRGEITPVSFKRKLRDLVEYKEGPVWKTLAAKMNLKDDEFDILEQRGRDRAQIREMNPPDFTKRFWDARLFGNTFLEGDQGSILKTGATHYGVGVSVSPVLIERMTTTNKAGVQEELDRGMAPLAFRIVQHGIYAMPFFVNPTAASKSGCTKADVDLMLALIPYAYAHNASYVRPSVEIRHAWYAEHENPLGSCSDFDIIRELTPIKKTDPEIPSRGLEDYEIPKGLPEDLTSKVTLRDLMANLS